MTSANHLISQDSSYHFNVTVITSSAAISTFSHEPEVASSTALVRPLRGNFKADDKLDVVQVFSSFQERLGNGRKRSTFVVAVWSVVMMSLVLHIHTVTGMHMCHDSVYCSGLTASKSEVDRLTTPVTIY